MGEHIDVRGTSTWIERYGRAAGAETVILLHGGISNSDDLRPVGEVLQDAYHVVAFDRRGHGRTPDSDQPFHYEDMAEQTIGVLDDVVGGAASLVGWSDGGIVALLVALRRPDLVRRLVLIGTDYHYGGVRPFPADAATESMFEVMKAAYEERSPDGAEHFPEMLTKATHLMEHEPTLTTEDIARVTAPTLVLVGDDDLIEHEHTVSLYEALPAGRLAIVPAASHMVVLEHPVLVSSLIADFLGSADPPTTMMPSRRAR